VFTIDKKKNDFIFLQIKRMEIADNLETRKEQFITVAPEKLNLLIRDVRSEKFKKIDNSLFVARFAIMKHYRVIEDIITKEHEERTNFIMEEFAVPVEKYQSIEQLQTDFQIWFIYIKKTPISPPSVRIQSNEYIVKIPKEIQLKFREVVVFIEKNSLSL